MISRKIFYIIISLLILTGCGNTSIINTTNTEQTSIESNNILQIGESEVGIYRCYELSEDSMKALLKDIYNIDVNEFYFKDNFEQKIYDQCVIASTSNTSVEINRVADRDKQIFIAFCVNIETGKIFLTIENDVIYKNEEIKNYFFYVIQPVIKNKLNTSGSYILKRTLKVLDNPIDIKLDLYHKINNLKYEDKTYYIKVQNAIVEKNELVNID